MACHHRRAQPDGSRQHDSCLKPESARTRATHKKRLDQARPICMAMAG